MGILYYKDQSPTTQELKLIKDRKTLSNFLGFSVDSFGNYGLENLDGWEIDENEKILRFKNKPTVTDHFPTTSVKFKDKQGNAVHWNKGDTLPHHSLVGDMEEFTGTKSITYTASANVLAEKEGDSYVRLSISGLLSKKDDIKNGIPQQIHIKATVKINMLHKTTFVVKSFTHNMSFAIDTFSTNEAGNFLWEGENTKTILIPSDYNVVSTTIDTEATTVTLSYKYEDVVNLYYYELGLSEVNLGMDENTTYLWKKELPVLKYARGVTTSEKTSNNSIPLSILQSKEEVLQWTLDNYKIKDKNLQLYSWPKTYLNSMYDGNFLNITEFTIPPIASDKPSASYHGDVEYFGAYPKIICVAENFSKTNIESGEWDISLSDTEISIQENGTVISKMELKPNSLVLLIQREPQSVMFTKGVPLYKNIKEGLFFSEPTSAGLWAYLKQDTTGMIFPPVKWVFSGGIFSSFNKTHYSTHSADFSNSLKGIRLQSNSTYKINQAGKLQIYALKNANEIYPSYITEGDLFYRENLSLTLPVITGQYDIADGKGASSYENGKNIIGARIGDAMYGRLGGRTSWKTVDEIRKENNPDKYKMTGGFSTTISLNNFPRPILVNDTPLVYLDEVNCYNNTKGDEKKNDNDILIYNSVTGWIGSMTRGLFVNSISLIDSNTSDTTNGESSVVDGDGNTLYYTKQDDILADGFSITKPAYWRLKYYCNSAAEYTNIVTPATSATSTASPSSSSIASAIYIVEPPLISPSDELFSYVVDYSKLNNTLTIGFNNNTNSNVKLYFEFDGWGSTETIYATETREHEYKNINEVIQANPYFEYVDPITHQAVKKYFSELI